MPVSRAKIFNNKDAKCRTTVKGNCPECKGNLREYLYFEPHKSDDAIFHCNLTNPPTNFHHNKKRQLRGNLRTEVASELVV